ncbi:MAG: CapA family protein [Desulfobacterales bacterium]|nr:CapA family protein [Desulfobacterales bacterium]
MMTTAKHGKRKKAAPSDQKLLLTAVGDVFLPGTVRFVDGKILKSDEKKGGTVFDKVAPYFRKADVNFCNLEAPLSDKGTPQAGRYAAFRSYPSMVEVLKKGKIDFVSVANNHSIDYGWEALSDTMDLLKRNGIGSSGGGKNMEEARKPALVKKKGLTIGLLSYTANVNTPMGFKASQERAGLAPMRISPFFLPDHTNQEDIEEMKRDVKRWKALVDFLVISFHWGISEGGTHTISLHQKVIARHAVHAGADLILGHHPHALQAVEIYKNKPICYSLGNFVFALEEGFPRETMLFQCRISRHKIHEVKFLPAYVSKQGQPEVVSPEQGQGLEIVSLMRRLCSPFGTRLVVQKQAEEVILKGKNLAKK